MTREELKARAEELNIKVTTKMTKATIEELINKELKESEKKEMKEEKKDSTFENLKAMLATIENCYILNETSRRLTTNSVMYCKRSNNKVRAYLKKKANHKLSTERNTQYDANVLIDLNDEYAIYTLRRLYAR